MTAMTRVPAVNFGKTCFMGAYLTLLVAVVIPLAAQAQDQAAGRHYAVAYVEVEASAVSTLRSAFARYREASEKEAGFAGVELLQQAGNLASFVIVDRWRDQTAIDAHAQADSTKRFRDALLPIRVTGYDERPYKDFAVGNATAGGAEAVYVVTHVDVAPPGDAVTLLKRLADDSRGEPGCLRFDVLQHTQRANHFTIIEAWRTRAARDRHAAAMHTRQYREALQPMIGSPLDERLMRLP
jgi:quinol monooxygenase YgiN